MVTTGGKLRVKLAIHTVGPVWRGGEHGEPERLAEAYRNCFALAASKGPKSIAVPSISTDTCGYPVEKASRIALETTKVLEKTQNLDAVFVLFSRNNFGAYVKTAKEHFPEASFSGLS